MDTVVAAATAWGHAALAVVRLSGPDALTIARTLCPGGPSWRPRRVSLRRVRRGEQILDEVLAVWMPGPKSYTGEDTVELSCHGNPVLVSLLLDACVAAGARPARPGEFTRRALERGRMDLLRAEAVAGLIEARSAEGVALARAGLDGAVSEVVGQLWDRLLDLAAELEARFDVAGEELGDLSDEAVAEELARVAEACTRSADTWRAGRACLRGARIALLGPVNAGKSSLFNQLLGEARALVSPIPGTTRDVVERARMVDGLELCFLDTAGERVAQDPIEAAGQALARTLTEDVDLTLVVLPLHVPLSEETRALLARCADQPHLVVGTHADLVQGPYPSKVDFQVSNQTGDGVAALLAAIRAQVGRAPGGAALLVLSQRQHDLLRAVAAHAREAQAALLGLAGPMVAAEELSRALGRLGELRGEDVRESVLDRVFAKFCIGK